MKRRLSIELDTDLVTALDAAANERCIGRTVLMDHILRDGLNRLIPLDDLIRKRQHREET